MHILCNVVKIAQNREVMYDSAKKLLNSPCVFFKSYLDSDSTNDYIF